MKIDKDTLRKRWPWLLAAVFVAGAVGFSVTMTDGKFRVQAEVDVGKVTDILTPDLEADVERDEPDDEPVFAFDDDSADN